MVELKLKKHTRQVNFSELGIQGFKKPIIFYLLNKHDTRNFFITFVIIDFIKNEILYLFSYNEENIQKINEHSNNQIFSIAKTPHCTISLNTNEDFLTFMEEEEFFVYVNYKKMIMNVYTMNDLVKDSNIQFERISSTFYRDDSNPNFFYISAVDSSEMLHIFRMSLTLDDIEEIDSFPSHPYPPHVLKKHKEFLFLSHEFRYSRFEAQKQNKIINNEEVARIFIKNKFRIFNFRISDDGNGCTLTQTEKQEKHLAKVKELFGYIREKYSIKCLPGNILLFDTKTKEKTYYQTSGGSPAHFEIDINNDTIYSSSHNFVAAAAELIFLEPAVIDKFRLVDGKLELIGSFSHPKGYRYTTHKIFYHNNKPYICVFGQPNRLMFIDATEMELLYYHDIGEDELSEQLDLSVYFQSRIDGIVLVALEVAENGEDIIFVGPQYIYFYNFPKRELYAKIDYKSLNVIDDEVSMDDYYIKTVHFNYLE